MSSVSTDVQVTPAVSPAPAKVAKPKKEKKEPATEKGTFVGRIADLEVSTGEGTTSLCIFHLKGKKGAGKQTFSIPVADPNLSGLLLQTALFSFASQLKVHITSNPANNGHLKVHAIKLSQKH